MDSILACRSNKSTVNCLCLSRCVRALIWACLALAKPEQESYRGGFHRFSLWRLNLGCLTGWDHSYWCLHERDYLGAAPSIGFLITKPSWFNSCDLINMLERFDSRTYFKIGPSSWNQKMLLIQVVTSFFSSDWYAYAAASFILTLVLQERQP